MQRIISLSTKITESFEQINETYKNIFDEAEKEKYVDDVWEILQNSYKHLKGGLAGSGFNSKEDMVKNIAFWKLTIRNKKVVAVGMYKDKGGRKRVASGTDGTDQGKADLVKSSADDIKLGRAYAEISKAPLSVLVKVVDIMKYVVPVDEVKQKLRGKKFGVVDDNDPEVIKHPKLKEFFYARDIGGEMHTKICVGNINSEPIIVH